ncbi:MAG: hypothetical protein DMF56_00810 [Acidobacteria bacterium]|nr:MAG: hypothetical protein DMF56_00810 [Acidobacteriota bacterium]
MALSFDKRIIGYGALNLHFDRGLGASGATGGKTLLTFIRSLYKKVNHVKVIIFRKATAEVPAENAIQLYQPDGTINQALIDNLRALVEEARRLEPQFWVQICVWHHQAIADQREYPDNAPAVLAPNWTVGAAKRLQDYYAPSASRQAAFAEHKRLFERIAREFSGYDNVLFEVGNEMRIWNDDRLPDSDQLDPGKAGDERNLKAWLAGNLQALRGAASRPIRVCTSSGIDNEYIFFKPSSGGLDVDFYDFHAGQWGMTDGTRARNPDKTSTKYPAGIRGCRDNAAVYKPGAKVLINTDGLFGPEKLETSAEFAQYMELWVREAFQKGVSFVTKGFYPPGVADISKPMLNVLERVANSIPE